MGMIMGPGRFWTCLFRARIDSTSGFRFGKMLFTSMMTRPVVSRHRQAVSVSGNFRWGLPVGRAWFWIGSTGRRFRRGGRGGKRKGSGNPFVRIGIRARKRRISISKAGFGRVFGRSRTRITKIGGWPRIHLLRPTKSGQETDFVVDFHWIDFCSPKIGVGFFSRELDSNPIFAALLECIFGTLFCTGWNVQDFKFSLELWIWDRSPNGTRSLLPADSFSSWCSEPCFYKDPAIQWEGYYCVLGPFPFEIWNQKDRINRSVNFRHVMSDTISRNLLEIEIR